MPRTIKRHPLDDGTLTWAKHTTGEYVSRQGRAINHYFSIAKVSDIGWRLFRNTYGIAKVSDIGWRLFRNTYGYIGDFKTLKKAKEAAQYLQDNSTKGWN